MKLTGKCKQDFEKWFLKKYKHQANKSTHFLSPTFYEMDFPFQYGVLEDFFDEKNMFIEILRYGLNEYDYQISDKENKVLGNNKEEIKTRKEARVEAINKANEIYNDKQWYS